ncbi:MAG: hypothetical protein HOW73_18625 [Polyangiaceae bacterium]|nr:hypothetical protein [Polyangiaceae bacterium]
MRASFAALALLSTCGGERGPTSAAPAPVAAAESVPVIAVTDPKVSANAGCERCHAQIAAEWRTSLHAQSWNDPVFLSAYAIEPLSFCRSCHAPEAPLDDASSPARHLGVACITCHVPDGKSAGEHVTFASRAADAEGCASCHQFEFPEPQEAAMQSTVEEHAASPHSDETCGGCHMRARPGAKPHRDHSFRVWGDDKLLARSIAASARRGLERTVEISLSADGAGHAVPTGDMFRRLEVRATAGDGADALTAEPVTLARSFTRQRTEQGIRRIQVGDNRVPASGEPAIARLVFPRPVRRLPVRWEVVYRRMGPREAALFGVDLEAEAIVVAKGTLDPEPTP